MSRRRQINVPLAVSGTFWRIKYTVPTTLGDQTRFHNQPFTSREAALIGAVDLERIARKRGVTITTSVVEVRSN